MRRRNPLELVEGIYDAALDPARWQQTLVHLAEACGARSATLTVNDPQTDYATILSPRTDPEHQNAYTQHWWRYNPFVPRASRMPPGHVYALQEWSSPRDEKRSVLYNEFWRHVGLGVNWLGANLMVEGGAFVNCVLHSSPQKDSFDGHGRRLFESLTPHLVRAAGIGRTLRRLELEKTAARAAGGRAGVGVAIVDAAARVLFADAAAETLFRAQSMFQIKGGFLGLTDRAAGAKLSRLIASCARPALRPSAGGRLAGRDVEIEVLPFRTDGRPDPLGVLAPLRAAAMLVISNPNETCEARKTRLRQRFGLTPAEASFALEVLKGDGREAAAARLGISLSTARTHLSRIFDKTGVRRQAELVRLLLGTDKLDENG